MESFLKKALGLILLVLLLGQILGVKALALEMTLEEFSALLGYKSVRKLSLGTFEDLLAKKEPRRIEVILKADIYYQQERLDYASFNSYKSFVDNVAPLPPRESIIIASTWIPQKSRGNQEELTLNYALLEDEKVPGYKFSFSIEEQDTREWVIKLEELFDEKYLWTSTVVPQEKIKAEHKDRNGGTPYFYAHAYRRGQVLGGVFPSGFNLTDLAKMANCYNVFIVFSFETLQH